MLFQQFDYVGPLYFLREREVKFLLQEIFRWEAYLHGGLSLSPGDTIFDIGANIGLFTLYALQKCNFDCHIHCFEPIPQTFECLVKNVQSYHDLVTLNNIGVGNETKSIDFTIFGETTTTATYRPNDKLKTNYMPMKNYKTLQYLSQFFDKSLHFKLTYLPFLKHYFINQYIKKATKPTVISCQISSMSDYMNRHNIQSIDFLKIDVEGAELDVLKGIDEKQFNLIKQISMEIHDIDNRINAAKNILQNQGFKQITVIPSRFLNDLGFNHYKLYAKK